MGDFGEVHSLAGGCSKGSAMTMWPEYSPHLCWGNCDEALLILWINFSLCKTLL